MNSSWYHFLSFFNSTCRRKANILKKHLSNNIERKKGTSWTLLNCSNICMKQLVHRYLQNNICYFRSRISPWRGPQLKLLFWAFFLLMVYIFTMQKISLHWGPLHPFLNIYRYFDHICFLKNFTKHFWYKIWVIIISKNATFVAWEVYWKRNGSLLLTFFLPFKNPIDPLAL